MKRNFVLCVCVLLANFSFAANRYWVGLGANQNWSNTANWSTASGGAGGASVPGNADRAIFDGSGNINCNIDVAVNIRGFLTQTGYTGTITQNNNAITCGNQDWVFNAGTFNGGGGAITINGTFTMGGGTFNCNNSSITESGAYTITAGTFNGNTAALDINNTMNLNGGTFTSTSGNLNAGGTVNKLAACTFVHNNGTIIFDGNGNSSLNVNAGSGGLILFYNMELNKPGGSDNLTINNNDTARVTRDLLVTDGQLAGAGVLQVQRNMSCLAATATTTIRLEFTGSANQQLTLSAGVTGNLNGDIVINQSTTSQLILNSPLLLDAGSGQTLTFVRGIIVSTNTNLLTIGDNNVVTGANNNSYVEGPVAKTGNDYFIFPTGNNGYYGPILITGGTGFTSNLASSASYTAQYTRSNPHPTYDTSMRDVSLTNISGCEYWSLTRNSGTANAYVWPSYESARSCTVTDPSALRVSRWSGTQWNDVGNGSFASVPYIRSLNILSTFGVITLASTNSGSNPLPVRFLDFTAILVQDKVKLQWSTASERNNAYFEIERSTDGRSFETIAEVAGSGYSNNIRHYEYLDGFASNKLNYYRIKQVDADGNSSYSRIIAINRPVTGQVQELKIYPNPATTLKVTLITGFVNKKLSVRAYDLSGKLVLSTSVQSNNSGMAILNTTQQKLPAGAYSIVVSDGNTNARELLLIR